MRTRRIAVMVMAVVAPLWGRAQTSSKRIAHQQFTWFAYQNTADLGPKWFLVSELHERRMVSPDRQDQFAVRGHAHRRIAADWDVSAGLTYFLQSQYAPGSSSGLAVPEWRPHVQVDGRTRLHPRLELTHRYRVERRFIHRVEDGALAPGHFGHFRFRYKLGLQVPVWSKGDRALKAELSDEVFLNAGPRVVLNTFDQNRVQATLRFDLNKRMTIGVAYLSALQQLGTGIDYVDRDIFRFTLEHRIGSAEPRKKKENGG